MKLSVILCCPGAGSYSESFNQPCFLAKSALLNLLISRSLFCFFLLGEGEVHNVSQECFVREQGYELAAWEQSDKVFPCTGIAQGL